MFAFCCQCAYNKHYAGKSRSHESTHITIWYWLSFNTLTDSLAQPLLKSSSICLKTYSFQVRPDTKKSQTPSPTLTKLNFTTRWTRPKFPYNNPFTAVFVAGPLLTSPSATTKINFHKKKWNWSQTAVPRPCWFVLISFGIFAFEHSFLRSDAEAAGRLHHAQRRRSSCRWML